jgi:uncharacterized protein affecting Mg2+/Co2+ transport
MCGSFEMVRLSGDRFDAIIPAFSLDSPYETTSIH